MIMFETDLSSIFAHPFQIARFNKASYPLNVLVVALAFFSYALKLEKMLRSALAFGMEFFYVKTINKKTSMRWSSVAMEGLLGTLSWESSTSAIRSCFISSCVATKFRPSRSENGAKGKGVLCGVWGECI